MCNNINTFANYVESIFNNPFFNIIGGISTLLMVLGFGYIGFLAIKGVLPVLYRLGIGLSKRKIAIFASNEYESLKSMLVDSNIFKESNIMQVNLNDLDKAANESMFLVHWKDYQDKIDDILRIKKDSTALIVYAPRNEGDIEPKHMMKINSRRNTIVVNFRGRLLNDIMISLITTGYEQ